MFLSSDALKSINNGVMIEYKDLKWVELIHMPWHLKCVGSKSLRVLLVPCTTLNILAHLHLPTSRHPSGCAEFMMHLECHDEREHEHPMSLIVMVALNIGLKEVSQVKDLYMHIKCLDL